MTFARPRLLKSKAVSRPAEQGVRMVSLKAAFHIGVVFAGVCSRTGGAEFTVVSTNDTGAGSLRQAIADANTSPGPDRIVFGIPGSGLQVIRPATALPVITDP